jgi:hypothetical protein
MTGKGMTKGQKKTEDRNNTVKGKGEEKKTEERIMKDRKRLIAEPLGVYCYSIKFS